MNKHRRISRRTILRGIGASLALPLLEVMEDRIARASSALGGKPPVRMAFLYVPNGVHMSAWTPRGRQGFRSAADPGAALRRQE